MDEENKDGQDDDDRNEKAWVNLSRGARGFQIMEAFHEAEGDGNTVDTERMMRVYQWVTTENWDKQRTETDAMNIDELNEDEATIDDDASSLDTMNGWDALKQMLEQGPSRDDDFDDNKSNASGFLMIKQQSNRVEDGADGVKEGEKIEEEEDDNDDDEVRRGGGGRTWTNGGDN